MPGYEVIGKEEQEMVNKVFTESKGVLYRYGFDALRSRYFVKEFEQAFAKKFKVKYALATSSGSGALKCALQALGVGKGDEVITQSFTFIATVEAICEVGATPVIIDIDKSLNMNSDILADQITSRTKVVIPVHMSGISCNMKKILRACEQNGTDISILEDNAQSPGGSYRGSYLGTLGDMGIFSFDGGKMLTTGEGGMIVTNNQRLYNRARSFSDHGHADRTDVPRGEDDCIGTGFNHKMMELQGAVGLAQLHKMDDIIKVHRKNKKKIVDAISSLVELRQIPNPEGDIGDSVSFFLPTDVDVNNFAKYWKYGFKNLPGALNFHFVKRMQHLPFISSGLIESQMLLERTVSIPVNYCMPKIDEMISELKELLKDVE